MTSRSYQYQPINTYQLFYYPGDASGPRTPRQRADPEALRRVWRQARAHAARLHARSPAGSILNYQLF